MENILIILPYLASQPLVFLYTCAIFVQTKQRFLHQVTLCFDRAIFWIRLRQDPDTQPASFRIQIHQDPHHFGSGYARIRIISDPDTSGPASFRIRIFRDPHHFGYGCARIRNISDPDTPRSASFWIRIRQDPHYFRSGYTRICIISDPNTPRPASLVQILL